ncbi:MAG: hypothetical protein R3C26_26405 [Calditrichia bacterium]
MAGLSMRIPAGKCGGSTIATAMRRWRRKNRPMKETINLPAADTPFYVTDDSHTPRDWNSPPPHDPAYYGD